MNSIVIPFPELEPAGWDRCAPGGRPFRVEGSLAAVLTLAPVIPLFPARPALDRSTRRSGAGKALR